MLGRKLDALHQLHNKIAEELTPIVDKSYFEAVTRTENSGKIGDQTARSPADDGMRRMIADFRNALELKIQTHLIASLVSEGAVAKDAAAMQPILDRFEASTQLLLQAAQGIRNPEIRKNLDALLELGRGSDNVFKLRGQELTVTDGANRVITENVKIQKQLDQAVSKLVGETETGMKGGTAALLSELEYSRMLLVAVTLISLLAAGLIAFFYVRRSLVRRLSATCDTMRTLSAGDNTVAIAGVKDRDEIGEMARALTLFRDAAVEKVMLEGQAAEDRRMVEEERARNDAARAEAARQVAQVVDGLGRGLERLAQGDLTYRVRDDWTGEYHKIQDDFNNAIDQLQDTLTAIVESTREVSSASAEISSSTSDLSQRTEEQAANLEETSASMEEISATVRKNAENAQHANGLMRGTRDIAGRGGEVVSQAVSAMSRIEEFVAQNFRHHLRHRRDRAPDQYAGAQRGGGSRARRRGRARLRGGRVRGAQSGAAILAGRQGHQGPDLEFFERGRTGRAARQPRRRVAEGDREEHRRGRRDRGRHRQCKRRAGDRH